MDNEENFIPSVHNFCDRWCERCEFTARCRVYAAEQDMTDEEKDLRSEAFVRNLENIFADARRMLAEKAEEFGIDLDQVDVDDLAEDRKRKRSRVKADGLAQFAEKYAWSARPVLAAKDDWLKTSSVSEDIQTEVLQVLFWYQFFIAVKIQRGLSGILDEDGDQDIDEINDPQSDANGSVKIALIAIERSILAWTYLLEKETAEKIGPLIELLERIKVGAEQKFPNARDFVRPGFDEIEIVM